jgi:hypothetical protein
VSLKIKSGHAARDDSTPTIFLKVFVLWSVMFLTYETHFF